MISFCICDDEATILEDTYRLIQQYGQEKGIALSIHTYSDSSRLIDDISNGVLYSYYLLDILMPLVSGLELAAAIREKDTEAHLIFLTSSPEFALESYEYHADHYLLKPVQEAKLFGILDMLLSKSLQKKEQLLTLTSGNTTRTVEYGSICYLESRRNKVSFSLNNQESFEIYSTLREVEELLCHHTEFVRIHRSFLINMNYIREVLPGIIILSTGERLTLSASYSESFKNTYFSYVEHLAHL